MITYIKGDILTPNEDKDKKVIVCHQVNCKGVMGAGLAKQIKDKFPDTYYSYNSLCATQGSKNLGKVLYCFDSEKDYNYIIANCFGQDNYGRDKIYTDYQALRSCFTSIAETFSDYVIRIPYFMGCGLAGGDWYIVLGMITDILKDCQVEIWHLN